MVSLPESLEDGPLPWRVFDSQAENPIFTHGFAISPKDRQAAAYSKTQDLYMANNSLNCLRRGLVSVQHIGSRWWTEYEFHDTGRFGALSGSTTQALLRRLGYARARVCHSELREATARLHQCRRAVSKQDILCVVHNSRCRQVHHRQWHHERDLVQDRLGHNGQRSVGMGRVLSYSADLYTTAGDTPTTKLANWLENQSSVLLSYIKFSHE